MSESKKLVCEEDVCLLEDENCKETDSLLGEREVGVDAVAETLVEVDTNTVAEPVACPCESSIENLASESDDTQSESDTESETDTQSDSQSETESELEEESDYEDADFQYIWLVIKNGRKIMACVSREDAEKLAEKILASTRAQLTNINLTEERNSDEYRLYINPCRNQFSFLFFSKLELHVELRRVKLF